MIPVILYYFIGTVVGGIATAVGLKMGEKYIEEMSLGKFIYPIACTVTGGIYALLYLKHEMKSELVVGLFLAAILVALVICDLRYRKLPNHILVTAIIVISVWRLFYHPLPLWSYVMGFVIGGGILLVASLKAMKKGRAPIGGGDIKLMALIGLAMGVKLVLVTLFITFAVGGIIGFLLVAARWVRRDGFIPLAPIIALASLYAWVYGESLLQWYLGK